MSELDILQFEVEFPGVKGTYFVKVLDVFQHHFTGETMRHIRTEYVDEYGACAEYDVMNEAEYKNLLSHRIIKN